MIKSKNRIAEFGEVFTSEREVNAMLDLVEAETYRIDSRFLEPACGDGNFLIEVLRRKLDVVSAKYSKNSLEFETYLFQAVSSIYGIDILLDNVLSCRNRLLEFISSQYRNALKTVISEDFKGSLSFVLSKNIIHGDAMTMHSACGTEPIIFSEWSIVTASKVKRVDYSMNNLLAYQPFESGSLFSDLGEEVFFPSPQKAYPLVHIKHISEDAYE